MLNDDTPVKIAVRGKSFQITLNILIADLGTRWRCQKLAKGEVS